MASNPYFSPYHTQRFSFIGSPQQRDGTYLKDQRFVNMYPELIKSALTDGKKYYLKKRPGTGVWQTLPTGVAQGIIFWEGDYYTAVGGTLFKNTSPILVMTQGTNPVGFAAFKFNSFDKLFVCDGTSAWTVDAAGVVVQTSSANFPVPHIPTPVFMDGYIFLANTSTQTIWNSDLGDPLGYSTDSFIAAEMYPDNVVALAKQQNYLVAIGAQSVEFFYDNANATGSPLQRNAPAVAQFGTPATQSVCQTEKDLILIGQTGTGGRTIWRVSGFQPTDIGNEPIKEALDQEGAGIGLSTAYIIRVSGHELYVLNLIGTQRTLVYDMDEQMWHEWTGGSGQSIFPYIYATDSVGGFPILQGYGGGPTVALNPNTYTDLGQTIYCSITTAKIDFDTIMRKRFYRLSLTADSPNGDTSTPMTVQWSDDDYNTWTSGTTIQVNGSYPTITQLGYSRRRAFRFLYQQPYPLRIESFELDIIQEVRR